MASAIAYVAAVVLILIIIGAVIWLAPSGPRTASTSSVQPSSGKTTAQSSSSATSTASQTGTASYATVPVGMTDPPSVPAGTQAVLITYSNVQIQTTGSNGTSGWVDASGSGTVNALAVVNASKTLATAKVAVNSTIDAVRMSVTSVKVVVNGTTYTATAPSTVTASVSNSSAVKPDSAVLVDLATEVTANASSSSNATSHTYVYSAYAAKAALTTNATVSVSVGAVVDISAAVKGALGLNLGSANTASSSSTSGYVNVPVGLTDPPSVPAGTQAVIISYSNVQVQTSAGNGMWINATGSGTVNALAVVNASQTIADAKVAANTTVDAVRMDVDYVKVIVKGTAYNATAPDNITADIASNSSVKANSAVLVDIASNVAAAMPIGSGNAGTAAYRYSDSSTNAMLTTNASVSASVGSVASLGAGLKSSLGIGI
jgi:hypothetical protein